MARMTKATQKPKPALSKRPKCVLNKKKPTKLLRKRLPARRNNRKKNWLDNNRNRKKLLLENKLNNRELMINKRNSVRLRKNKNSNNKE